MIYNSLNFHLRMASTNDTSAIAPPSFAIKSRVKVFDGHLVRFTHSSSSTRTTMTCAVYIPEGSTASDPAATLLYLSGLTCNDENVCQKSGVFRSLSELKVIVIMWIFHETAQSVIVSFDNFELWLVRWASSLQTHLLVVLVFLETRITGTSESVQVIVHIHTFYLHTFPYLPCLIPKLPCLASSPLPSLPLSLLPL